MRTVNLQPARVIVDPNSVVRGAPELTAARFDDADRVPHVGEIVIAAQPDADGGDYVGAARVVRVNEQYRLIFLDVDWATFHDPQVDVVSARVAVTTSGWPGKTRGGHGSMLVGA